MEILRHSSTSFVRLELKIIHCFSKSPKKSTRNLTSVKSQGSNSLFGDGIFGIYFQGLTKTNPANVYNAVSQLYRFDNYS